MSADGEPLGHVCDFERCLACGKGHAECDVQFEPCSEQDKARELVADGLLPYEPEDWDSIRGGV